MKKGENMGIWDKIKKAIGIADGGVEEDSNEEPNNSEEQTQTDNDSEQSDEVGRQEKLNV